MLAQPLRAHQMNLATSNTVMYGCETVCLLPGTEVVEVREWFRNREDMLDMREVNKQTQLTTEYFSPGHLLGLKGILAHLGSDCS